MNHRDLARLAIPDLASVCRWGRPSVVEAIQRGTVTIPTGATTATWTIPVAVDPTRTRLLWQGMAATNLNQNNTGLARVDLTNATTVTATRNTSDAGGQISLTVEVIQYAPGVIRSIQRGTVTQTAGSIAQTIARVDPAKTTVEVLGMTSPTTSAVVYEWARIALTDATTLTAVASVVVNQVSGYQVTEWM